MKMKRNPITNAIQKALFAGFVASSAFGTVALAQDSDDGEDVEKQDKITVTGSRIKRADVEGALPVTIISREDIELSGESNAADFIRNLTFNSTGSFRPQSGSSAQGESQVSLRGLGSSRTLVLVDGRRLPKSPATGSAQNLSLIPMGAIERFEILTDGASAIYGSDAIGGVINIITREDYEGAEIMIGGAEVSIPTNGGEREEGSVLFGASGDRSSVVGGVSWNDREIIFARDFPWYTAGASVYSNNFTTLSGGYDNFNFTTLPGACSFPDTAFSTMASGSSLTGERCAYNYAAVSADEASIENKSFYLKAKHQINDNWELWGNTSFSQAESFGRYAPVPDSSYFGSPLSADSLNNPTNPNSPLYDASLGLEQQAVNWWHRFDALGNRDTTVTSQMLDFLIGTTGQVGPAEVEFGLRHTDNRTSEVGENYLLRSAAFAAIESGTYSLANPYGTDEDVLDSMRMTIYRYGRYDQDEVFASAAFDLFEVGDGAASMFVGAEYREEKYVDKYDPQSEAGMVGGSAGNSAAGTRDITSAYFEALFPFFAGFEMSVAGRYDDYSDFGDNFSPKVSFRYQPMDSLTLRASYGEGFRAPSLDILHAKTSYSATSVKDPQSCLAQGQASDCSLQINNWIQANSELEAETSKQYSLGVAYEPFDWMNMTVDYYNISIDNRIRSFSAQDTITAGLSGDPTPPGVSCQRSPINGAIIVCYSGYVNQGTVDTEGVDLNIKFNYDLFGGKMTSNVQLSHMLDYKIDNFRNLAKDPGVPENRMVISNVYAFGDWSFGYNFNLIGDQYNKVTVTTDSNGAFVSAEKTGHVPTWITHDFQVNYHAPWNGKFTVGVRNAGEKYPPIGLGAVGSRDYDFALYDGYGRVTYARYTQTF